MPIEGLKEECGLFAVFGLEDAALHTALALHAQQHRGQEGAGIVTLHEGQFQTHKAAGLVSDHFPPTRAASTSTATARSATSDIRPWAGRGWRTFSR